MAVYLGLDYGKRRIGVAAGDDERSLAFAVATHVEGRDGSVLDFLRKLALERGAATLVVGLPLTADGQEGEMAQAARRFAGLLEDRLGLEVVLWDERFSSAEADRWLVVRKQTVNRHAAKEDRDALAAEIILQSYLDHLRAEAGHPASPEEES